MAWQPLTLTSSSAAACVQRCAAPQLFLRQVLRRAASAAQDPCCGLSTAFATAVRTFDGLPPAARRAAISSAVASASQVSTRARYLSLFKKDFKPWCVEQQISDFPITESKINAFFAAREALGTAKAHPGGFESITKALAWVVTVRCGASFIAATHVTLRRLARRFNTALSGRGCLRRTCVRSAIAISRKPKQKQVLNVHFVVMTSALALHLRARRWRG